MEGGITSQLFDRKEDFPSAFSSLSKVVQVKL